MTPAAFVAAARTSLLLGAAALAVLLLGPFQGLEAALGVSDTAAHALAFYAATLTALAAAPGRRRVDIALCAVMLAVLSEVGQAVTGRSASPLDLAADFFGIALATAPGFVEQMRRLARTSPESADDRRRPARESSPQPAAVRTGA